MNCDHALDYLKKVHPEQFRCSNIHKCIITVEDANFYLKIRWKVLDPTKQILNIINNIQFLCSLPDIREIKTEYVIT